MTPWRISTNLQGSSSCDCNCKLAAHIILEEPFISPKRPWQPQTWQDLTRFSPLDFSLLSPDFRGLVLLINTGKRTKNPVESLQWRRRPEIADFCPLSWSNLSWQLYRKKFWKERPRTWRIQQPDLQGVFVEICQSVEPTGSKSTGSPSKKYT